MTDRLRAAREAFDRAEVALGDALAGVHQARLELIEAEVESAVEQVLEDAADDCRDALERHDCD